MGDKCNCYRFSPRDSLSGAVAQIADYLSKHPGWNETELGAFVDGLISSAGVETFNGRSGNVTLNKDDVNNLLIANCYFAEADETIESIDVLALYKLGIRIVFTQYSSEVDGYTLAYGIEYYPGTDTAKAYLFSSGSGGGTGAIVSVNGKTGVVVLKASDILMNDGDSVEMAVSSAQSVANGAATDATNALNKANAAYSADNAPPYPVISVNGKTGSVTGLYDSDNQPPYPVISVNGKTGSVTGLYDSDNQPPYPVTSVNGKTGSVTGLYDSDNQPPYPVISVNGKTGSVTGLYDVNNPPPYPVKSVNGLTGNVSVHDYYYHSYGTAGRLTIGGRALLTVTIGVVNNFTVGGGASNYINIASWAHDSVVGIGASLRASNYGLCGISLIATSGAASVLFNNQNSYDVGPTEFIVTLYNFGSAPLEITFN